MDNNSNDSVNSVNSETKLSVKNKNDILLKDLLNKKRNIVDSTLTTYSSLLRNLYKNVFGDGKTEKPIEIDKFNESKKIIDFLKEKTPETRKTTLSALFVISDEKEYRDLMIDDIRKYNKDKKKRLNDDKTNENWVDDKELKEINNKYKLLVKEQYKKEHPNISLIQEYVILNLYNGLYIPPRRSKDYTEMKIVNKNVDIDKLDKKFNYYNGKNFYFNNYKTSKYYGQQIVEVPKGLRNIINKMINSRENINENDYLFTDVNNKKLNSVKMTQRLNKIFDKKTSINIVRKVYMTNKYSKSMNENEKNVENMKKDFEKMGSSILQDTIYVKKK